MGLDLLTAKRLKILLRLWNPSSICCFKTEVLAPLIYQQGLLLYLAVLEVVNDSFTVHMIT